MTHHFPPLDRMRGGDRGWGGDRSRGGGGGGRYDRGNARDRDRSWDRDRDNLRRFVVVVLLSLTPLLMPVLVQIIPPPFLCHSSPRSSPPPFFPSFFLPYFLYLLCVSIQRS